MKVEVLDGTQHFISLELVPRAAAELMRNPDAWTGQGKYGPTFELPDEIGYDLLRSVSLSNRETFNG